MRQGTQQNPNCGAQLAQGSKFCDSCGAISGGKNPKQPQQQFQKHQPKKNTGLIVVGIVAWVVVIAIAIVIVIIEFGGNDIMDGSAQGSQASQDAADATPPTDPTPAPTPFEMQDKQLIGYWTTIELYETIHGLQYVTIMTTFDPDGNGRQSLFIGDELFDAIDITWTATNGSGTLSTKWGSMNFTYSITNNVLLLTRDGETSTHERVR